MKIYSPEYFQIAQESAREALRTKSDFDWSVAMEALKMATGHAPLGVYVSHHKMREEVKAFYEG